MPLKAFTMDRRLELGVTHELLDRVQAHIDMAWRFGVYDDRDRKPSVAEFFRTAAENELDFQEAELEKLVIEAHKAKRRNGRKVAR
jgi:hypothetical protein